MKARRRARGPGLVRSCGRRRLQAMAELPGSGEALWSPRRRPNGPGGGGRRARRSWRAPWRAVEWVAEDGGSVLQRATAQEREARERIEEREGIERVVSGGMREREGERIERWGSIDLGLELVGAAGPWAGLVGRA